MTTLSANCRHLHTFDASHLILYLEITLGITDKPMKNIHLKSVIKTSNLLHIFGVVCAC